jgi:membrane protein
VRYLARSWRKPTTSGFVGTVLTSAPKWGIELFRRLKLHQAGEQAAVIAFSAIYAMFPLLLSLTAIGGVIFRGPAARALTLSENQTAFPPQMAKDMIGVINAAGTHAGLFGLIGFVSLLWTGSNLFTAIEVSFSRIFSVPRRGLIFQRIVAFLMIFLFATLLAASVAVSNVAVLVTNAPGGHSGTRPGWLAFPYLGLTAGWIVSTLALLVIYGMIPNVRLPFRAVWPGALLAGTSLQITTLVFPLYVRFFAGFNRFGDAFGLMFLTMTWFYVLAFILLAGAEINALYYASVTAKLATTSGVQSLPAAERRTGKRVN